MRHWWLFALVGIPSPALADWQYTRWGMTVDEVITASNGTATKVKDNKDLRVLKMPRLAVSQTTDSEAVFKVEFYFKDKKLALIRYEPSAEMDCPAEEEFFLNRFGAAEPNDTTQEFRNKNLVLLKSRTRIWTMPSGDSLQFNIIRIERPDLPNMHVTPMCNVLIRPTVVSPAQPQS